jgi:hypothetical protein
VQRFENLNIWGPNERIRRARWRDYDSGYRIAAARSPFLGGAMPFWLTAMHFRLTTAFHPFAAPADGFIPSRKFAGPAMWAPQPLPPKCRPALRRREMQHAAWQRPVRRFALPTGETRFGSPALMSACAPTDIPMSRATFTGMAARETADQIRNSAMRRFSQQARGGAYRQHADVRVQF